ncbi:MAG: lysine--tRNA ligase [Deltaproteobacteria bacterium]|nr:lysine--tRNA ligase [Deltaproteobacteria bacterium]MBW2170783.1 lysine--tRNA ligase [Deltaproteobacteria bacterium]
MDETSEVIRQRREKAQSLADHKIELYPNDFRVSHTIGAVRGYIDQEAGAESSDAVFAMAGRIVALRSFGKATFIQFRDYTGELQAYVKQDEVGKEAYALFKQFDVGDFIGLKGGLFQTRTGEWTLLAKEIRLLCKALRPLPEKFHRLRDPEKRYRQRYLDLIMNPDVRDIFIKRAQIITAFRAFLLERGFLEVETPMMQPIPGGAEATPFKTFHDALGMELFLRIAPELYLKRLVIGGFDRVFEINRSFRNEGVSSEHNPEFTMLEFYQAYANHEDLMSLTEEMFQFVTKEVLGQTHLTYQGNEIDMAEPWSRITLENALTDLGGIEPSVLNDRQRMLDFAKSEGIEVRKAGRAGKVMMKLFDVLVEPKLIRPTFVVGYPVEVSPLARRSNVDPNLTERFELFIGGREIANGFSELNDPVDQKNRFLDQVGTREAGDQEAHYMDEDYVMALEYGMPSTAGEGVGIDRFVMLLTNAASIREVILFPQLRKTSH